jgi:enoyl-CoA hydratase/carnithine racemase
LAKRLGIVNEVVGAEALIDRAWAQARELLDVPDLTRRYTRIALVEPIRRALQEQLGQGLLLEGASIAAAGDGETSEPAGADGEFDLLSHQKLHYYAVSW